MPARDALLDLVDGRATAAKLLMRSARIAAALLGWILALVPAAAAASDYCLVVETEAVAEPPRNELAGPDEPLFPTTKVAFLNHRGGRYYPGRRNDSGLNVSTVLEQAVTIPRWDVPEREWLAFMDCMRSRLATFDITVVDDEPRAPAVEVVIGGSSSTLQLAPEVGGVAPFASGGCEHVPRAIAFVFPESIGQGIDKVCEIAAHELGHTFGLDHSYHCPDLMTYLDGCGAKQFRDAEQTCGEDAPRACRCEQTQNSFRKLLATMGPRLPDDRAPSIQVRYPSPGAHVGPGFEVKVEATDERGIAFVELYVDGERVDADTVAPYALRAPADLPTGPHDLAVIASDGVHRAPNVLHVVVDADAETEALRDVVPLSSCALSARHDPTGALVIVVLIGLRRRQPRSQR